MGKKKKKKERKEKRWNAFLFRLTLVNIIESASRHKKRPGIFPRDYLFFSFEFILLLFLLVIVVTAFDDDNTVAD